MACLDTPNDWIDLVIAGLLHDAVEDAGVDAGEIERAFGERVAALVRGLTKPKIEGDARRTWGASREAIIRLIREGDGELAAVKAADTLHNASATLADVRAHGATVWARFNAPADEIVWYYDQVRLACAGRPVEGSVGGAVDLEGAGAQDEALGRGGVVAGALEDQAVAGADIEAREAAAAVVLGAGELGAAVGDEDVVGLDGAVLDLDDAVLHHLDELEDAAVRDGARAGDELGDDGELGGRGGPGGGAGRAASGEDEVEEDVERVHVDDTDHAAIRSVPVTPPTHVS